MDFVRGFLFHVLSFFRGPVHLVLNIISVMGAILVLGLTLSLFFNHKEFWPMLTMDIVAFVVWFGCFILKFKYDVLILKLQPKDINITLFR
jgi:hypothetical protein